MRKKKASTDTDILLPRRKERVDLYIQRRRVSFDYSQSKFFKCRLQHR